MGTGWAGGILLYRDTHGGSPVMEEPGSKSMTHLVLYIRSGNHPHTPIHTHPLSQFKKFLCYSEQILIISNSSVNNRPMTRVVIYSSAFRMYFHVEQMRIRIVRPLGLLRLLAVKHLSRVAALLMPLCSVPLHLSTWKRASVAQLMGLKRDQKLKPSFTLSLSFSNTSGSQRKHMELFNF